MDYKKIIGEISTLLTDTAAYDHVSRTVNPYGTEKRVKELSNI